jgi:hypothetical protein
MTITSTEVRESYAGNGSTTAFSYPQKFLADADLIVISRNNTTGVETLKTITTHYTVSGAGADAGGTVTMLVAPASGTTLIIYLDPTVTQDLDLGENDSLPAEEVEERFDKLTLIAQRLKNQLERSVRLRDGFSPTFTPTLPADLDDAADKVPLVNSGGTGFADAADWPSADDIADAQTNATAAAASASAASTSATAAAASATSAAASAVTVIYKWGGTVGGTADAITLTPTPALSAYSTGIRYAFLSTGTNTTAVTVAISGLAAKSIKTQSGAALAAGNITSGRVYSLTYDGTNFICHELATPENASVTKVQMDTTTTSQSNEISNLGLAGTVGGSALTIALKNSAGSDPSTASPVRISFRNSTAATGQYAQRAVTAALSQVINSGVTLGMIASQSNNLWIYAIDSDGAGTIKLGACTLRLEESVLQSSVAESFVGTISNASPGVVTSVAHGLLNGDAIQLTTTGGLPTGLSTGTTYYVVSKANDTFQLSATVGGSSINTSSAGSGVHTVRVANWRLVSDAVYASKPVRLLGRFLITVVTPGTWVAPTGIDLHPLPLPEIIAFQATGDPCTGGTANAVIVFPTLNWATHGVIYNTTTGRMQAPKTGYLRVSGYINASASAGLNLYVGGSIGRQVGVLATGINSYVAVLKVTAYDLIDLRPSQNLSAGWGAGNTLSVEYMN